jgi:hypothetical protein
MYDLNPSLCNICNSSVSITKCFFYSDNTLDVTLWDALSGKFIDFFNNWSDLGLVVLIIKHARVKEAQG